MNCFLSSGTSSRAKIESDVHTPTHAPQSMQVAGSTYICVEAANFSSSSLGWMQSTGHALTHSESLMQLSVMTYAMSSDSVTVKVFQGSLFEGNRHFAAPR